jgi:hypothetical protein
MTRPNSVRGASPDSGDKKTAILGLSGIFFALKLLFIHGVADDAGYEGPPAKRYRATDGRRARDYQRQLERFY